MSPTGDTGGDRGRRVRIGDAERDEVLAALQEHLSAGRLTVEEYEERAAAVVAARYAEDLRELLADLPPTEERRQREERQRRPAAPLWWRGLLPFPVPLLVGLVVLAVILAPGPPFLLFPLLWFMLFFGIARGRRWHDAPACDARRVV